VGEGGDRLVGSIDPGDGGASGYGGVIQLTNPLARTPTPRQLNTKTIWDIYQRIAGEVCEPVFKMLSWFEKDKPKIDAVSVGGLCVVSRVAWWLLAT
jgi:hypothetical protein